MRGSATISGASTSCRSSRRSSFRPSKGPPLADERTANAGITSAQHLRQTDIKDRDSLD
ncbi:hypothetical protein DPMN_191465 [Dreissena polymorpha]|uniref:Uncharacterized protein n=1 Tax=Dreissena polymorpha TaxID=45954 RepID=A0A9D3XZU4_DREPO|nr:hypothetical protein DPMN_191465 [Dreissena polymorpha]